MGSNSPRRGPVLRGGLALLSALLITACGGAGTAGDPARPADAAVTIEKFAYEPASMEVVVGTEITWTNEDLFGHTVTSGEPTQPSGVFDGSLGETTDGEGATFSWTATEPGTYPYFCDFHPDMRGTVTVTGS